MKDLSDYLVEKLKLSDINVRKLDKEGKQQREVLNNIYVGMKYVEAMEIFTKENYIVANIFEGSSFMDILLNFSGAKYDSKYSITLRVDIKTVKKINAYSRETVDIKEIEYCDRDGVIVDTIKK